MLRQIIDGLALGQMVGVMAFMLAYTIRFLGSMYVALGGYIMRIHKRDCYFVEYLKNRKAFMEWVKERDKHD